eukprot:Gb_05615 [translate_table: standard]
MFTQKTSQMCMHKMYPSVNSCHSLNNGWTSFRMTKKTQNGHKSRRMVTSSMVGRGYLIMRDLGNKSPAENWKNSLIYFRGHQFYPHGVVSLCVRTHIPARPRAYHRSPDDGPFIININKFKIKVDPTPMGSYPFPVYYDQTCLMNAGIRADQEAKDLKSRGATERDLLIVGPGVLGRLVAESWLQVT